MKSNSNREITNCPHTDRRYYAKGMCHLCYRNSDEYPRAACHPDKPHMAKGMCKNCYDAWNAKNSSKTNTNCPHTDRPHHARGMCSECSRKNSPVKAICHPNRAHRANGLCKSCYIREAKRNNEKKATCHPDKPHFAKGLCDDCYRKTLPPNSVKAICHPQRPHYSNGYCRICDSKNTTLLKTYGISLTKYLEFYKEHGGRCDICKKKLETGLEQKRGIKDIACIDHDHQTKAIRGMLCYKCNSGIGYLRDDPKLIKNALEYFKVQPVKHLDLQDWIEDTEAQYPLN